MLFDKFDHIIRNIYFYKPHFLFFLNCQWKLYQLVNVPSCINCEFSHLNNATRAVSFIFKWFSKIRSNPSIDLQAVPSYLHYSECVSRTKMMKCTYSSFSMVDTHSLSWILLIESKILYQFRDFKLLLIIFNSWILRTNELLFNLRQTYSIT